MEFRVSFLLFFEAINLGDFLSVFMYNKELK